MSAVTISATVENFLVDHGIPFPGLSTGAVYRVAKIVREFREDVGAVQSRATKAVEAISQDYQSAGSERMLVGWQNMWRRNWPKIEDGSAALEQTLYEVANIIDGALIVALYFLENAILAYLAAEVARDVPKLNSVITNAASDLERILSLPADIKGDINNIIHGLLSMTKEAGYATRSVVVNGIAKFLDDLGNHLEHVVEEKVIEGALVPWSGDVDVALGLLQWSAADPGPAPKSHGFTMNATGVWEQVGLLDRYAEELREKVGGMAAEVRRIEFS